MTYRWSQRTGTAIRALARITNLGLARGVGRQQTPQISPEQTSHSSVNWKGSAFCRSLHLSLKLLSNRVFYLYYIHIENCFEKRRRIQNRKPVTNASDREMQSKLKRSFSNFNNTIIYYLKIFSNNSLNKLRTFNTKLMRFAEKFIKFVCFAAKI